VPTARLDTTYSRWAVESWNDRGDGIEWLRCLNSLRQNKTPPFERLLLTDGVLWLASPGLWASLSGDHLLPVPSSTAQTGPRRIDCDQWIGQVRGHQKLRHGGW
jgi:hypothetical protein